MRKIWFGLIGLLSLLPAPLGTAAAASPTAANPQALLQITRDDRILGNPDAPVTIIEYASMTCPHCAHFQGEVLPEIKKQWIDTDKAKLVLRDFPLDEEALRAAMIARCAPSDRYYAFADTFFAAQSKWVGVGDYREALARLARLGGMSKEEFDTCLRNKRLEDSIVQSRFVASKELDVNSTPTFFINGAKYTGAPTVQDLTANLQAALPASATAEPVTPARPAPPPAVTAGSSAAQPQSPVTASPSAEQTAPSTPAPPANTQSVPAVTPTAPPTPKPSTEAAPPATEASHNIAEATPTPAAPQAPAAQRAESADAGKQPDSSLWDRVRGWFHGLFGSHS